MSYAKFDDENEVVLQLSPELLAEARDGDWIPFERLLKVDHYAPEYQSHALMPSFYAQAWLTVHYGLIENRVFGGRMIDYLKQLNAASLANLKGRQEDIEGMVVYLKDAERFASNLGMRHWATETLAKMSDYLARKRQAEAEQRRQREAYEKELAEYEKKYGKAKRKK